MYKNAGYTVDQTVIIVTIVAILISVVIATIGWEIISRAGGSALTAQLRQIERANGDFVARHSFWAPFSYQGASNDDDLNMLALKNALPAANNFLTSVQATDPIDRLKGLNLFGSPASEVRHTAANGGRVSMRLISGYDVNFPGDYLIVEFENIPLDEAENADEAFDGQLDRASGRIRVTDNVTSCLDTPGDTGTAPFTRVCYVANFVQI